MSAKDANAESIKRLKRRVWRIKGFLYFRHSQADLELVIENLKKIDRVPCGYLYPELIRKQTVDPKFQEMLKRKVNR